MQAETHIPQAMLKRECSNHKITLDIVDALADTFTKVIEDLGGRVTKRELWGLRSLSFRIKKNRKGHYVMVSAEVSGEAIAEIERQASINEDIIRWLTIKVDELEKGPSVMMRKQERRGGRGRDRDGEE